MSLSLVLPFRKVIHVGSFQKLSFTKILVSVLMFTFHAFLGGFIVLFLSGSQLQLII